MTKSSSTLYERVFGLFADKLSGNIGVLARRFFDHALWLFTTWTCGVCDNFPWSLACLDEEFVHNACHLAVRY